MKKYYQLNRHILKYAAIIYLVAFSVISAACVFVILYFYSLDSFMVASIGVASAILLTGYILLQLLVTGNYEFQRRMRIYSIPALSAYFKNNGFAFINAAGNSKFDLLEPIMSGRINTFLVEVIPDEENQLFLLFQFKIAVKKMTKEEFSALFHLLKQQRATFTPTKIILKIEIGKLKTESELSIKLDAFIHLLLNEGFRPLA